ncbi:hypothetical protein TNCV_434471 [Trichonephila clavipes]|nr:hypothetical protein TNCV_434471 [Trichonephila clavipes]
MFFFLSWLERIAISAPKKPQEDINRNRDESPVTSVVHSCQTEEDLSDPRCPSPMDTITHVNIRGNKIGDRPSKEGSENETATGISLTYHELYCKI